MRAACDRREPTFGSKTVWVGERAGDGHRLKLALNSWVLSITAATGQAIALARHLGVAPQLFLDAIAGGGTNSPYAQLKEKAMMQAVHHLMSAAADAGHADEDMAAVVHAFRR